LQTWHGVAGGHFVAPNHELPSHLELTLTATDSRGLKATKTVDLDPKTVKLTLVPRPKDLKLKQNGSGSSGRFSRTVIANSKNEISAPSPQALDGAKFRWDRWSDERGRTHFVRPQSNEPYVAWFDRVKKKGH
jgi:hypothetical protein